MLTLAQRGARCALRARVLHGHSTRGLHGGLLRVSEEVQDALSRGAPVVALESTIITHGMPADRKMSVAQAIEAAIRKEGAVPATTALLDGVAHVGLDASQIERISQPSERPPIKTSRRDLAQVLAHGNGTIGGTTVSGTMVLAHMAGIDIFATGGIGGVHRGGQTCEPCIRRVSVRR